MVIATLKVQKKLSGYEKYIDILKLLFVGFEDFCR